MHHLRRISAGIIGLALLAMVTAAFAQTPEPKAVSEDDAKWLLGDAEVIFKVNIKQMLASDLMKKGKDATVDAIKNGGQKAASISKEMKTALEKFSGKESVTIAMVVTDEIKKLLANVPRAGESAAKLQTVTAAVTLTSDVELNV